MAERAQAGTRAAYPVFRVLTTRWMDNDGYGHLNNAVYYSLIDTAVTGHLMEAGALTGNTTAVIGLAVESGCRFFSPIAFPEPVTCGIRVGHRGRSSVRYEVGLFAGDAQVAAAEGFFVHVYVDRAMNRTVPLPDALQRAIASLSA